MSSATKLPNLAPGGRIKPTNFNQTFADWKAGLSSPKTTKHVGRYLSKRCYIAFFSSEVRRRRSTVFIIQTCFALTPETKQTFLSCQTLEAFDFDFFEVFVPGHGVCTYFALCMLCVDKSIHYLYKLNSLQCDFISVPFVAYPQTFISFAFRYASRKLPWTWRKNK